MILQQKLEEKNYVIEKTRNLIDIFKNKHIWNEKISNM